MAHLQKKGKVYYLVDKSFEKPKWIKLGEIKQIEAKAVLAKYETDQTYLRLGVQNESPITFSELYKLYLEHAQTVKSANTVKHEKEIFEKFGQTIGNAKARELKVQDFENLLKAYPYKPNSLRLRILALRALYKFAIERGYLKTNPALELKRPKIPVLPPKHVDPKVIEKVFKQMSPAMKSKFMILFYTGMRPSEMLRLQAQDVNLKAKNLTVRYTVRYSKTNRFRVLPLHPTLIPIFSELLQDKKEEDYLFPSRTHEHQVSLRQSLEEACRKAKVKGVTPYVFRHQFATSVLEKTGNLRLVQQLLGHSNIQTTTRYATSLDHQLRTAVEAL